MVDYGGGRFSFHSQQGRSFHSGLVVLYPFCFYLAVVSLFTFFKKTAYSKWFLLGLFCMIAAFATFRNYAAGVTLHPDFNQGYYTLYNNYVIFKQSFFHLIQGKDLYALYPSEHWDYYKYSPTFALFFGIFAYLPDAIGLLLWNLLNCLVLAWGILKIRNYSKATLFGIFALLGLELFTATLNSQSNALITGLLLLAFTSIESKQYSKALLFIMFTGYIKIFGIALLSILVFYPSFLRNGFKALFWLLALWLLPIPFCHGWEKLIQQYQSYLSLLGMDHSGSVGYSMMGWLNAWFGLHPDKLLLVAIGMFIQLWPCLNFKKSQDSYRFTYLCSWLIWLVIFNHKAESPTFVIAAAGALLWYFSKTQKSIFDTLLLLFFIAGTMLTPTDLFPKTWRPILVADWQLKVAPCIFIWFKMQYELFQTWSTSLTKKATL